MRPHNGAVQQDALHIGVIRKMLMHILPDLMLAPPRKAFVNAVPMAQLGWQQAPLGTTTQNPQDGFNELATGRLRTRVGPRVLL